jgi:hypothetical protein
VAIYDALLFLMVVILISVGMFLYTASTAPTDGSFSDSTYQRMAEDQLTAVEQRIIDSPKLMINWTNGTDNLSNTLDELVPALLNTTGWLFDSYCILKLRTKHFDYSYDMDNLEKAVAESFNNVILSGTHFAWAFIYENETVMEGSDIIGSIAELPDDRWAVTRDYTPDKDVPIGNGVKDTYEAELRFFFWLA